MENNCQRRASSEASEWIDEFIGCYYASDFKADFLQLTPQQRIGVFLKCVAMRLPKFKAIDVHTDAGIAWRDLYMIVGKMLRHPTPQQ